MSSEKKLKKGFTTGTAAAAAAKGALFYLLSKEKKKAVTIRFLTDETTLIPIYKTERLSENKAESIVIKDAGDDPDVTHKAEIGARVSIFHVKDGRQIGITITGGTGVGRVTKSGLEVPPGRAAINPGPETMILESVNNVLTLFGIKKNMEVQVEIFVPKGEELAQKTLNSRLGIKGGISILGTTGIVNPMSHEAYIATIKYGISVAKAMGSNSLVFTTGRRSERFAMALFPELREDAFIQIGDFFKASLEEAEKALTKESTINTEKAENTKKIERSVHREISSLRDKAVDTKTMISNIKNIIITVFFGKAVKMAMGFPHTHAAKSELTLKKLAQWAENLIRDKMLAQKISKCNSARHAFTCIYPDYPEIISFVGKKIIESARKFSHLKFKIRVVIFDFNGTPVFDSSIVEP